MNILSYRGPSTPGGVSATLSRVIDKTEVSQSWWYLHGSQLRKKGGKQSPTEEVCQIPFKIIEGHYRYCNDFLWPILHELPQYAIFNEEDRQMYKQLNTSFAWNVLHSELSNVQGKTFVNDYQLALCPQLLSSSQSSVDLFWHIPWPAVIKDHFVDYLVEIAEGLLSAKKIGFHIDEYLRNFLTFVDSHVSDCLVDFQNSQVIRKDGSIVSVVAHPLGIDREYWQNKLRQESFSCRDVNVQNLNGKNFVLSVDRADYTKGVFHRLQAIELFFSQNAYSHCFWPARRINLAGESHRFWPPSRI